MPSPYDTLEGFLSLDRLFYAPGAQRFYDCAIARMLQLLDARPGEAILDAGCGAGPHAIRAAAAGFRVHAVDSSAPALAEARSRARAAGVLDRLTFTHADLVSLPFKDGSIRRIFSWGVVIHIPAIEAALDSLARVLQPGGRLALYVTNGRAWDYRAPALARTVLRRPPRDMQRLPMGSGHWYRADRSDLWVWRIDIDALTDYLTSRGLRLVHRLPGALTEMFVRLPRGLAALVLEGNTAWFRLGLPAGPAAGNLLVFDKPADDGPTTPRANRPSR